MGDRVHPEQEFLAYLEQGEFMLQRSRSSGNFLFYPRVAEPGSGAMDLEWVKASGAGTVYSTTVIRQKPPKAHYNLALLFESLGKKAEAVAHFRTARKIYLSQ